MTVPWQPGQTTPDTAVVALLQSLPPGAGLVLELSDAQLPSDDSGRAELAQFAASLAQQTPTLRDLVLTPAPSLATDSAYADALAALRAAVVAVSHTTALGPTSSPSTPRRSPLPERGPSVT
jgi:hypothetical protein